MSLCLGISDKNELHHLRTEIFAKLLMCLIEFSNVVVSLNVYG